MVEHSIRNRAVTSSNLVTGSEATQFVANRGELLDRKLEVCIRMGSRDLGTDARRAVGHHRIEETDNVQAALEKAIGRPLRKRGITDHHRNNRMFARLDDKTIPG